MIRVSNISLNLNGCQILEGVSCQLQGGVTAVLGQNGAGKSSLLKCMAGSLEPQQGEVLFDGVSLRNVPLKELAKRRAVLSQNLDVAFPYTALEIVLMGRSPFSVQANSDFDRKQAEKALQHMRVDHLKDRQYSSLSGGEKQRVQIARALTQIGFDDENLRGRYIFLDEPTSALDVQHQSYLRDVIRELSRKGAGILCVLHDVNYAWDIANTIIFMKNGRVMADHDTANVLDLDVLQDVYQKRPTQTLDSENGRRYYWF